MPSRRNPSPGRLVIAATLVGVAFLAGFAARGWATGSPASEPEVRRLLADATPRESAVPDRPEVVRPASPAPVEPAAPAMPEYVKAQWARLGYQVEPKRRVISVEEDGRRETFPVDSYRLQFVGRPTY